MNTLSLSLLLLLSLVGVSYGQVIYCDADYNSSSCANTTLTSSSKYKCRGFLSCKDSTVSNNKDLFCQGDRSCKNVVYESSDDDELWAFGYRSADSLTMSEESKDGYCYGYQSCLDIVYAQSQTTNDAEAHGYQSMYNAYIDYSNAVDVNGYEGLYYATINTTSVYNSEIDITINGYYGSYETDVLCQDGITCNFYAYGWYSTEETYLYCLRGSTCNVYCGTTNGCNGMNIYAYSTATVYFDCDDATECPNLEDAEASAKLMAYSKSARQIDDKFDKIMNDRLNKKYSAQYEFKQERMREEKMELAVMKKNGEMRDARQYTYTLVQSMVILVVGIVIGIITTYGYNKCVANKAYSYQPIV